MPSVAGSPPIGTITTFSPALPGAWYVTVRSCPCSTSSGSGDTMTGGVPSTASTVETTAR